MRIWPLIVSISACACASDMPGFKPADDRITTVAANAQLFVRKGERLPDVGAATELAAGAKLKSCNGKSNPAGMIPTTVKPLPFEKQFGAENLRVAVKFSLPEPLANDDDIVATNS